MVKTATCQNGDKRHGMHYGDKLCEAFKQLFRALIVPVLTCIIFTALC